MKDRFFFDFSIFRQTSQLATKKIQNLCNHNRWSGLLQLGSVRFRSFFQSRELDLRTLYSIIGVLKLVSYFTVKPYQSPWVQLPASFCPNLDLSIKVLSIHPLVLNILNWTHWRLGLSLLCMYRYIPTCSLWDFIISLCPCCVANHCWHKLHDHTWHTRMDYY